MTGASPATLANRLRYGGRKARSAERRLAPLTVAALVPRLTKRNGYTAPALSAVEVAAVVNFEALRMRLPEYVDGVRVRRHMRVLLVSQPSSADNGVYRVSKSLRLVRLTYDGNIDVRSVGGATWAATDWLLVDNANGGPVYFPRMAK